MPTSIKQNTLTICEVSYGPAEEAVLHFANRHKSQNTFTGKTFENFKYYIQNSIEDDNWCERIEIRIPNPLLKVKKTFCVCTIKVTEYITYIKQIGMEEQQSLVKS